MIGHCRVEPDRLALVVDGKIDAPNLQKGLGAIDVTLDPRRIEPDRFGVVAHRQAVFAHQAEGRGAVGKAADEFRIELDRAVEIIQRGQIFLVGGQRIAAAVESRGAAGSSRIASLQSAMARSFCSLLAAELGARQRARWTRSACGVAFGIDHQAADADHLVGREFPPPSKPTPAVRSARSAPKPGQRPRWRAQAARKSALSEMTHRAGRLILEHARSYLNPRRRALT